jgi:hypothetical protein
MYISKGNRRDSTTDLIAEAGEHKTHRNTKSDKTNGKIPVHIEINNQTDMRLVELKGRERLNHRKIRRRVR